jgi:hypothetical protein
MNQALGFRRRFVVFASASVNRCRDQFALLRSTNAEVFVSTQQADWMAVLH